MTKRMLPVALLFIAAILAVAPAAADEFSPGRSFAAPMPRPWPAAANASVRIGGRRPPQTTTAPRRSSSAKGAKCPPTAAPRPAADRIPSGKPSVRHRPEIAHARPAGRPCPCAARHRGLAADRRRHAAVDVGSGDARAGSIRCAGRQRALFRERRAGAVAGLEELGAARGARLGAWSFRPPSPRC